MQFNNSKRFCNYELKWSYDRISSMLTLVFKDESAANGLTKYYGGIIYPHLDNLWYFAPRVVAFNNDSGLFYWNDIEGEMQPNTRMIFSNRTYFQLKQFIPYEIIMCARITIMIFDKNTNEKTNWKLVYRASSFEIGAFDCPLPKLIEPRPGILY